MLIRLIKDYDLNCSVLTTDLHGAVLDPTSYPGFFLSCSRLIGETLGTRLSSILGGGGGG